MKLTDTIRGKDVKVTDLAQVNEMVRRRLNDMGIMEGAVVSLRKLLPFGGPCTIETKGQWIAVRLKEARCIQVEAI